MEFRIFAYIPTFALIILSTVHINIKWGKKGESFVASRFLLLIAIGLFFVGALSGVVEFFLTIASLLFASIITVIGNVLTDYLINSTDKHVNLP